MITDNVFSSFRISGSGMSAQRKNLEYIANNIANASTTRTPEGGPYKRVDASFEAVFDEELGQVQGVDLGEPVVDTSAARMVFDAGHPDANKEGYVAYPNVDMVSEMVKMVFASRSYDANVQALTAAKDMIVKSFEIAR
jgi:flagellar basal-body rod protein FlgC